MESKLNEQKDRMLNPFVFERDDEFDMCEVSVEHEDGWEAISILI